MLHLATQSLPNKEIHMKANRFVRVLGLIAASALTTTGLAAVATAPADAATKSTIVILSTGDITSLNSGTNDGNTAYNAQLGYLTGAGFSYYDDNPTLIMNTKFGSMKVVKNTAHDFRIQYTIRPGQVWSDGTPIDAVDLLLSHVVQSDAYSKAAGLGDPANDKPKFDSAGYSGAYAEHVVGEPTLSADKMSETIRYDQPMPDWQLLAPGPSAVHALELLADGKKGLGTASANLAAKAKFLSDFKTKSSHLAKLADVWTNAFNIQTITPSTNKLLLISNGGYILDHATKTSWTLVRNPKYTSGPALTNTNGVKTVVIKVIQDNSAAVQALRNGDIDLYYNTLPTGADKSVLSAMAHVTTITKVAGGYSHFDLRTGPANGQSEPYTGPFAGNGDKAKDLRHAFLLAAPREQMVATLIKPVMSSAVPMDTQFAFTGSTEYNTLTKASGVAEYSAGTQAQRTARALALVKKWYPNAASGSNSVSVNIVHANTSIRNNIAALLIAEERKAGFEVVDHASSNLFGTGDNHNPKYDAMFYGFGLNSISQGNSTEVYKTTGGNNQWGWSNATVDTLASSLQSDYLTAAQVTAKRLQIDKIVHDNYWGLPLYQNPTITTYNQVIKNVKPSPIGANVVWNYWEWHF
jgi:peptide/nickel transport system substrate-binding protein